MSNWSTCNVGYSFSNIFDMRTAKLLFEANMVDDYLAYGMTIEDLEYDYQNYTINITGEGRWEAPHKFLCKVATVSNADMTLTDLEPGSNFFIYIEYIKGQCTKDISTEYLSLASIERMSIDWFEDEIDYILQEDYNELSDDAKEVYNYVKTECKY